MRIATATLLLVALVGVSSHPSVHGGRVQSSPSQPLRLNRRRKLQQQQLWLGQVDYVIGPSSPFALDAGPFVLPAFDCVAGRFVFKNGGVYQYKSTIALRRVVSHEQAIHAHLWLVVQLQQQYV